MLAFEVAQIQGPTADKSPVGGVTAGLKTYQFNSPSRYWPLMSRTFGLTKIATSVKFCESAAV